MYKLEHVIYFCKYTNQEYRKWEQGEAPNTDASKIPECMNNPRELFESLEAYLTDYWRMTNG